MDIIIWWECGCKLSWPNLRNSPEICFEGWGKPLETSVRIMSQSTFEQDTSQVQVRVEW
jgi:hypothetical protein